MDKFKTHVTVTLTVEEAEVVNDYIFRKAIRLEDAHLEDSRCYPALMGAHIKLHNVLKQFKGE